VGKPAPRLRRPLPREREAARPDGLELRGEWPRLRPEDANHTVYITGFPWLYTAIQRYVPEVGEVFLVTVAAIAFLLWNYCRTWTGIWVPIFSGLLSSVWALGMGPLLGPNLDSARPGGPVLLRAGSLPDPTCLARRWPGILLGPRVLAP
jgi:predicted RND superfamily exporter protein